MPKTRADVILVTHNNCISVLYQVLNKQLQVQVPVLS